MEFYKEYYRLLGETKTKLKNNALTREEADNFITAMINLDKDTYYSFNGKVSTKKSDIHTIQTSVYHEIDRLCTSGFKLSIKQFIDLAKSSKEQTFYSPTYQITRYYSGKEMYEYCVQNNTILSYFTIIWGYFVDMPFEMIDFVINHNDETLISKYLILKNLQFNTLSTEYIEKYLNFYEKNITNLEFKINTKLDNITYEQSKRYIKAQYSLGTIYGSAYFEEIVKKYNEPNQIDELYDILLDAIEHNAKHNRVYTYNIYNYINNIILREIRWTEIIEKKIISRSVMPKVKIIIRVLPKLGYFDLREHFEYYRDISSYDMHQKFLEQNELPEIFKISNMKKFFKKYKIRKYYNEDKVNDLDFLKEFYEEILQYFKDFGYTFPNRYDSSFIRNIKTYLIVLRQLLMMFDLHTNQPNQKINTSTYLYKIMDRFEELNQVCKQKYLSDFNEFYRLFAN